LRNNKNVVLYFSHWIKYFMPIFFLTSYLPPSLKWHFLKIIYDLKYKSNTENNSFEVFSDVILVRKNRVGNARIVQNKGHYLQLGKYATTHFINTWSLALSPMTKKSDLCFCCTPFSITTRILLSIFFNTIFVI